MTTIRKAQRVCPAVCLACARPGRGLGHAAADPVCRLFGETVDAKVSAMLREALAARAKVVPQQ